MLVTALVLLLVVALCDHLFGIKEPWRKLLYVGVVILFVVGLVQLLIPGFPLAWRI